MRHLLVIALFFLPLCVFAANFSDLPSEVIQSDGTVLNLLSSGDEYANWLHDINGYTVIQSQQDGYFYYAERVDGEPAPSVYRYGSVNPANVGISPRIVPSKAAHDRSMQYMEAHNRRDERGPNTGTVNNLNVFIRFSDQTEFELTRQFYDDRFNAEGDDAVSLRNYFHKASYNQLNYVTHHFPVCAPNVNLSYQDSHPRAYFMPYNAITNSTGYQDSDERTYREHTLLANAIAFIAPQVPASLNIDADNDGSVDNVCFIIRGPHTAWADLLWAHRWVLYAADANINGKQVWDFTFQPEDHNSARTLCHEMFHSVGSPDLYHYTFDGITPAGCWDIMESGNGHMGMYMKYAYGGWLNSIPAATTGNTYTLNPVTSSTNNVLKLAIPGSNSQYLVFEYRKRGSDLFEAELPGSGLLIYRINQNIDGNADGPPDEVYIFRPNGSPTANGLIAEAVFSEDESRTEFNAYTNPYPYLTNGNVFQVNINSISTAGETISFQISPTTGDYPPVITGIQPVSGSILPNNEFTVSASVSVPNGEVMWVDFSVDGTPVYQDFEAPWAVTVDGSTLSAGEHTITITAIGSNVLQTTKTTHVRLVDPEQQNWFSWLSDSAEWEQYGRGAVPIEVAVDFDLGDQEYYVRGIRYRIEPDPWGFPGTPGLVNARINRFAGGTITEQTLLTIGDILDPSYDPDAIHPYDSSELISGEIAVILDLSTYQNMLFDINAPCGHSWVTEPDRPWTDAMGRGMLGSASIELLLQAPITSISDPAVPQAVLSASCYPNPFRDKANIIYTLRASDNVTISIHNIRGQKVATLDNGDKAPGTHTLIWDGMDANGRKAASGIYFYRISTSAAKVTGKLLLTR